MVDGQVGCRRVQNRHINVLLGLGQVAERVIGHIILKRDGGEKGLITNLGIKVEPI